MIPRVLAIAFLLIAGIFAGAQLGKIAPLVGWYQSDIGLSLVAVGWLTSMIGIFVALVALPAGWGIERFGVRRASVLGSLVLAVGALAIAVLTAPAAILAARLVEGLGYVVLVIALPALLTQISLPSWRAPVLAVWSCFVPVGFAISDLAARGMLPDAAPSTFLLVIAGGFILFAGLGLMLLPAVPDILEPDAHGDAPSATIGATLSPAVMLTALSFGAFVVQSVSLFSFAPAYAVAGGILLLSAGAITMFSPVGNVAAGALVAGAGTQRIMLIAAVATALTAVFAYPVFSGFSPTVATIAAVAFCIGSAVIGSALFAVIPALVPKGGSVSIALGLVAQAGGLGTLFGPPIAAWVIETFGWMGLSLFLSLVGVAGLVAILPNLFRAPPAGR